MALNEQMQPMQKTTEPQALRKFMGSSAVKSFASTNEVREFPMGKIEILKFDDAVVGKATLQPGWRWSKSLKEIAGTESCEAAHFQYHVSGTLHVKMDNGKEFDCKAGDISMIPPGHDAWVVGNEPVVLIDFQGLAEYAKPAHKQ